VGLSLPPERNYGSMACLVISEPHANACPICGQDCIIDEGLSLFLPTYYVPFSQLKVTFSAGMVDMLVHRPWFPSLVVLLTSPLLTVLADDGPSLDSDTVSFHSY